MQYRNHTTNRTAKNLIVLPWTVHVLCTAHRKCAFESFISEFWFTFKIISSRFRFFFRVRRSLDASLQLIIVFMNVFFFIPQFVEVWNAFFPCALINIESMFYCWCTFPFGFLFGCYCWVMLSHSIIITPSIPIFKITWKQCARTLFSLLLSLFNCKPKKITIVPSDCCCRHHHLRCCFRTICSRRLFFLSLCSLMFWITARTWINEWNNTIKWVHSMDGPLKANTKCIQNKASNSKWETKGHFFHIESQKKTQQPRTKLPNQRNGAGKKIDYIHQNNV